MESNKSYRGTFLDVGRSTKIALAQRGKGTKWLAEKMGVSRQQAANYCSQAKFSGEIIERLADTFELEVSEFVKLAEGRFE